MILNTWFHSSLCMYVFRFGSVPLHLQHCKFYVWKVVIIFPNIFPVQLHWQFGAFELEVPKKETANPTVNCVLKIVVQQQMQAARCNNAKPVEKCCATRWHTWNAHSVRIESAHLTVAFSSELVFFRFSPQKHFYALTCTKPCGKLCSTDSIRCGEQEERDTEREREFDFEWNSVN